MTKGKLRKITINPETHCLKLRFSQHPSETNERVIKKFLVSYLLSDHQLKEYSEVCQGGVPDLVSESGNLCVWLEAPKPRDYTKASQEFDFQLVLSSNPLNDSLLSDKVWRIESYKENEYLLNGINIKAELKSLE